MYVGECSLEAIGHFLAGYDQALIDMGQSDNPIGMWRAWLRTRLGAVHDERHWTHILSAAYGDDSSAIQALPGLYEEFVATAYQPRRLS
jgi:hypothetical protein